MRFIRYDDEPLSVSPMRAKDVKCEFANIEVHLGTLNEGKFKAKSDVVYEDELLVIDGGKRIAKIHARNFGKVSLEKKAIRIAAMNFEIIDGDDVNTVSGSVRLELGDQSSAWYQELWG